jgi:hypothetical protein
MEAMRIEAEYRQRGDGVIADGTPALRSAAARAKTSKWAKALYADFLGVE